MKNMEVILTSDVYGQINEYAQALTKYPISTNRAHDKIKHMINTLNDIGTSISSLSPCPYEDLGQKFTNEGHLYIRI